VPLAFADALLALAAIPAGTLYRKEQVGSADLRTAVVT
jgi:hypothetical protein